MKEIVVMKEMVVSDEMTVKIAIILPPLPHSLSSCSEGQSFLASQPRVVDNLKEAAVVQALFIPRRAKPSPVNHS